MVRAALRGIKSGPVGASSAITIAPITRDFNGFSDPVLSWAEAIFGDHPIEQGLKGIVGMDLDGCRQDYFDNRPTPCSLRLRSAAATKALGARASHAFWVAAGCEPTRCRSGAKGPHAWRRRLHRARVRCP